jgi:hypothetical protein
MPDQPSLLPAPLDAGEQRVVVRCRGCRRPLYSAEARALGVGPECREQEYAARRFDVEQEQLPGM